MKARFVLQVRLLAGREDEFLRVYGVIRERVARGVPGCLSHQACQSVDDPRAWMITSEWEDVESYRAWEKDAEHRALTAPLRQLWDEARLTKYGVRSEVAPGEGKS